MRHVSSLKNDLNQRSSSRTCGAAWARRSGLRLLQEDVLAQRDALLGAQRSFADTVNDYIEKKVRGE